LLTIIFSIGWGVKPEEYKAIATGWSNSDALRANGIKLSGDKVRTMFHYYPDLDFDPVHAFLPHFEHIAPEV
jgi:hypothetical protein